jgi:hypothetical protein
MLTAFIVMVAVNWLPKADWSKDFWMRIVGTQIHWPWYTLIGATVTLGVAFAAKRLLDRATPPVGATKASETRINSAIH